MCFRANCAAMRTSAVIAMNLLMKISMTDDRKIVMLTTSERGGIVSVVECYERDGVFTRWPMLLVFSHVEGTLSARLLRAAAAFFQVLTMSATGRIALLHCHVSMYGSFWRKALLASTARLFGVPVLLHLHGSKTEAFYRGLPPFAQRLVQRQLATAERVLVLSDSWARFVREVAPEAQVVVLPNYVDVPVVRKHAGSEESVDETRPTRLLFLGLIGQRKGVYELIEGFAAAAKHNPRLRLCIAGNGEEQKARTRAQELGVADNVEFAGWIDAKRRNALLAQADIFLLPSHNEGLPMSVLEAMAWGVPVITTPVGGIPELIEHGTNGLLVEVGNIKAIQAAIEQLALDGRLREKIGHAGRETVRQRFSREHALPKLEELYAQYVPASSGPSLSATRSPHEPSAR